MDQVRGAHGSVKPASDTTAFFQVIAGLTVAALVMLGVGGTVYNLVAPGGWLLQVFGRSAVGGMAALLALTIVALCAWLGRRWISVGSRNRRSEVFVYAFAVVGAIYAFQYFGRGVS
ncbi:MAG: hypothetical protein H7Y16_02190 [Candidatus Parcubacteria bacterium]|nr:hypothetical protein [Burkholderiales bacterium]